MIANASACRSCGAPIWWLVHEKTGNRAPINAVPDPGGDLAVNVPGGKYKVVGKGKGRYTSHYATCPQGREWRGGRGAK